MSDGPPDFLSTEEPLPFERLFFPFILDARVELRRRVAAQVYELLTPQAHAGWERYLLSRLVAVSAKAADWQFQVFKTVRAAFPREQGSACAGRDSLYRAFVGEQPTERLQKLFAEFPAMAKLCDVLVINWLSATTEFLHRLDADRNELGEHFEEGRFVFPVTALQAGLSDPHRGGRCVVRMTFENGASLIYKPRSLAPEAHFSVLLDQLNTTGIPHVLRSARSWDRAEYGWMENIEHSPCTSDADVHAFYWRAGALLGVVYLARGVDIHRGNIIAAGEFPVLIDLEALWHSQKIGGNRATTPVDSVLRTGFLPLGNPRSTRYECSGLSRQLRSDHLAASRVHINVDGMVLDIARRGVPNQSHLPALDGAIRLATEYVSDIQAGFQWAGEILLEDAEKRENFGRWLHGLTECPRRLILRPTACYQADLEQHVQPQTLRKVQVLAEPTADFTQSDEAESNEELKALEQFDVPYFDQVDEGHVSPTDFALCHPPQAVYQAQLSIIAGCLTVDPQA